MNFTSYATLFLSLTPLSLIITTLFLILFQDEKNWSFYIFCISCFLIGFAIEVVGVNTNFPFGEYNYGKDLGFKVYNTPLSIGVNWLLLSLAIGSFSNSLSENKIIKILIASSIMVLIDFLIEPVAIHFNWWNWKNTLPDLYNYLGWFFTSVLIFTIYFQLNFGKKNNLSKPVLLILVIFFLANIVVQIF